MTGGGAYIYDPDHLLATRLNRQLVDAGLLDDAQADELRFLIAVHHELTRSTVAAGMLEDWDATLRCFWRVAPVDEIARIERANEGLLGTSR
jgi:glutamate synthase domain-containing protein 3